MVVFLQAEPFARFDDDAFHLVAVRFVEDRVGSPGAVRRDVNVRQLGTPRLESTHDLFDLLTASLPCDQQRVGRIDDQQVIHIDGGNELLGDDQVARGIDVHRRPSAVGLQQGVGITVMGKLVVKRIEAPQVAPPQVGRDDFDPAALLHNGVVDGVFGDRRHHIMGNADQVIFFRR